MKKFNILIDPKFTECYSIEAATKEAAINEAFKQFKTKKKVRKDYKMQLLNDQPTK